MTPHQCQPDNIINFLTQPLHTWVRPFLNRVHFRKILTLSWSPLPWSPLPLFWPTPDRIRATITSYNQCNGGKDVRQILSWQGLHQTFLKSVDGNNENKHRRFTSKTAHCALWFIQKINSQQQVSVTRWSKQCARAASLALTGSSVAIDFFELAYAFLCRPTAFERCMFCMELND